MISLINRDNQVNLVIIGTTKGERLASKFVCLYSNIHKKVIWFLFFDFRLLGHDVFFYSVVPYIHVNDFVS